MSVFIRRRGDGKELYYNAGMQLRLWTKKASPAGELVVFDTDKINVCHDTEGVGYDWYFAYTANPIDLTSISTVKIRLRSGYTDSNFRAFVGAASSIGYGQPACEVSSTCGDNSELTTVTLDVSALTGNYHILLAAYCDNAHAGARSWLEVTKVWGER